MVRIFTKLFLILFVFTAAGVILLIINSESHDSLVEKNKEEVQATTLLTGRFIEHTVSERIDKLYSAAYAGDSADVLRGLVDYTDFIGSTYGHKGSFMIGMLDSGFRVVNGFNSTTAICSPKNIVDESIAKRLLLGNIYVGSVTPECAKEFGYSNSLMLFAVPIVDKDGFDGAVYEISTLMDYINSYNVSNGSSGVAKAQVVLDDIARYDSDSEIYKLLTLKGALPKGGVAEYKGRLVGFHSFYVQDVKLTLIYIKDIVYNSFDLKCCPWLSKYKGFVFFSPLVMLILWIFLEVIRVNEKLGKEVEIRTKHLQSIQKRYRGLFGTIPEYVVLYKMDGEILETNERFIEVLKGGNPKGANLIYMIREKERFRRMIDLLMDVGTANFGEFLLIASGDQIAVSVNSSLMEIEGEYAILSVMTDLTNYKKLQKTYSQAERREVVGTLAAGMVHDFSNILQNISLQYSLLERSSEDTRDENMKNIKKILEGANKYLTGVLSYTKDTKNDFVVKKGSEFVKDSIEMLERVLPAEISIDYTDDSGNIQIKAIQTKMTQLLINLCQNASDAMNSRGLIKIRSYTEQKAYGHFFCLSVQDSGTGIPAEILDNIYKPFFTTKNDKGTGLGLATVKQVVIEFGGFIEVASTVGVGTEFILMFSEKK